VLPRKSGFLICEFPNMWIFWWKVRLKMLKLKIGGLGAWLKWKSACRTSMRRQSSKSSISKPKTSDPISPSFQLAISYRLGILRNLTDNLSNCVIRIAFYLKTIIHFFLDSTAS
jgi:hypothetical protein